MMDKVSIFRSPNKVIFGNGVVSQVGDEAAKMGAGKASPMPVWSKVA
jgi:hypothetical protein